MPVTTIPYSSVKDRTHYICMSIVQGIYSATEIPQVTEQVPLINPYGEYARDGVWLMAHSLHRFIQSSLPNVPDWTRWHQFSDSSFITNTSFSGNTVCNTWGVAFTLSVTIN